MSISLFWKTAKLPRECNEDDDDDDDDDDNDDDDDDNYKSGGPRTPWNMIIRGESLHSLWMTIVHQYINDFDDSSRYVLTHLVKDILEASLSGLATAIHLSRKE